MEIKLWHFVLSDTLEYVTEHILWYKYFNDDPMLSKMMAEVMFYFYFKSFQFTTEGEDTSVVIVGCRLDNFCVHLAQGIISKINSVYTQARSREIN